MLSLVISLTQAQAAEQAQRPVWTLRMPAQPLTEADLVERCKSQDRRAQQLVYERHSAVLFTVCQRYMPTREDAEDMLVECFCKIFDKIGSYQGNGSFEGWMRRVTVNECLMALRKKHNFQQTVEFSGQEMPDLSDETDDQIDATVLLGLLDQLPTGYRTIFNLYVLEGYKHREIADMLGISINTSKSQLILAKEKLKLMVSKVNYRK